MEATGKMRQMRKPTKRYKKSHQEEEELRKKRSKMNLNLIRTILIGIKTKGRLKNKIQIVEEQEGAIDRQESNKENRMKTTTKAVTEEEEVTGITTKTTKIAHNIIGVKITTIRTEVEGNSKEAGGEIVEDIVEVSEVIKTEMIKTNHSITTEMEETFKEETSITTDRTTETSIDKITGISMTGNNKDKNNPNHKVIKCLPFLTSPNFLFIMLFRSSSQRELKDGLK